MPARPLMRSLSPASLQSKSLSELPIAAEATLPPPFSPQTNFRVSSTNTDHPLSCDARPAQSRKMPLFNLQPSTSSLLITPQNQSIFQNAKPLQTSSRNSTRICNNQNVHTNKSKRTFGIEIVFWAMIIFVSPLQFPPFSPPNINKIKKKQQ
ncbi:hypothetical protein BCR33DRAFT_770360 [Rhizoclosmatium globosum]|uniref:Uncharacterized protein n=1 Tax=Rhizoclosmatium globosum TaxID=329046 RepID=A0A1Y2BNR2_9FUNG|nr:hypothetical protein BCR33DRAFT_770360 [Rhizoclosmatium globosum]|eukprot:ORY36362.1 hypothetical protein BCR33DRAFT_770360 [Rhizoclosmatium globosum]